MDAFYFIAQQTFSVMVPLMIVALGGLISEKSGVVNIALEGIMIMGAFVGIYVISLLQGNPNLSPSLVLILGIVVGGAVGGIYSLLHALASVNMKANQTISGTALNLFAPAFAIFVARTTIGGTQQIGFNANFRISEIPFLSQIPILGDIFFKNTYISFYVGLFILLLVVFVLHRTKIGLRIRACGENPHAADAAGISIAKIRYLGVVTSGIFAGMGGVILIATASSNEFNATVSGYGFLALAVLIFGNWKPGRILLASLFFGLMSKLSAAYSLIPFLNNLGLPMQFYLMIPYLATLVVLILTSKNSNAPKASGEIYDKGKR